MTATNHAITGALIGLAVSNPALAVPLAFISHFALDAIPHYDSPGYELERIGSTRFRKQLSIDASLCFLLVVVLALRRPEHWLVVAFSAFMATFPDLLWLPKFLHVRTTGKLLPNNNFFWKFHDKIQWRTGSKYIWVEATWFIVFGGLLSISLL